MTKTKSKKVEVTEDMLQNHLKQGLLLINKNNHWIMSIDQAFDKIGMCFVIPSPSLNNDHFLNFLQRFTKFFDQRLIDFSDKIVNDIAQKLVTKSSDPIEVKPEGKAKAFSIGKIFWEESIDKKGRVKKINPNLFLLCQMANDPSDEPEWKLSDQVAEKVYMAAKFFYKAIPEEKKDLFAFSLEGLALTGMSHSLAMLPCLGILYASIWRKLSNDYDLKPFIYELPISSWKKQTILNGRAKKKQIKEILAFYNMGRLASDDEIDALGMALSMIISLNGNLTVFKNNKGRIRPTKEQRDERAEKRKVKKLKKEKKSAL